MADFKILGKVKIAISGKSGCGNTTVSTLLSQKIGAKLINFTFRQLAKEKGLTLSQIIENAKSDDSYDIEVDTRQVALAKEGNCVLGSRLAIWMLKEADLKIYLLADIKTRANRIQNREGGNLNEIKSFTSMRDKEDSLRYKRLYGIDNSDFSTADLKIDTAKLPPEKIVEIITSELEKRALIKRL